MFGIVAAISDSRIQNLFQPAATTQAIY